MTTQGEYVFKPRPNPEEWDTIVDPVAMLARLRQLQPLSPHEETLAIRHPLRMLGRKLDRRVAGPFGYKYVPSLWDLEDTLEGEALYFESRNEAAFTRIDSDAEVFGHHSLEYVGRPYEFQEHPYVIALYRYQTTTGEIGGELLHIPLEVWDAFPNIGEVN